MKELDYALHNDVRNAPPTPVLIDRGIRKGHTTEELYNLVFGLGFLEPFYVLRQSGVPIEQLSPGEKGTLLLMFYLLVARDRSPLILDQPDENLDNQTINDHLVPAVKEAKRRRQVIIVTHNPNVAVVADADQLVAADFVNGTFSYRTGAIESPSINATAVDVLEGTWPASRIVR